MVTRHFDLHADSLPIPYDNTVQQSGGTENSWGAEKFTVWLGSERIKALLQVEAEFFRHKHWSIHNQLFNLIRRWLMRTSSSEQGSIGAMHLKQKVFVEQVVITVNRSCTSEAHTTVLTTGCHYLWRRILKVLRLTSTTGHKTITVSSMSIHTQVDRQGRLDYRTWVR